MATHDYKKGLEGKEPGILKEVFDKEGYADQKRGYQDFLRNADLAERIRGSERSSYGGSGYDSGGGEYYSFKFNLLMWGIIIGIPLGGLSLFATLGAYPEDKLFAALLGFGLTAFLVIGLALSSWSSQPKNRPKR